MNIDMLVLKNALTSFLIFWVLHLVVLRFVGPHGVLKWLVNVIVTAGGCNVVMGWASLRSGGEASLASFVGIMACVGLSISIYGLIVFIYILCVFGLHESSIRIRMLRELYAARPRGLSREELLERYNADVILRRRLERLMASGEVTLQGTEY